MFRSRSWFGGGGGRDSNTGGLWKPKNPHSLEYLKYLHGVLSKNQSVSESNKSLLVETLRSISEILIWGDQNDSTVFDFFLEKNMLSYFLQIMKQKCGSYVCVQLLQTLNILFENIRNETSLYYLLSNNHVNSIIEHKFDFSDEEVMAYYISFLKTLSFKLNSHTIHFFYNEHTHDFPLYTEAIKFFNNSESMVRIAVRTLTLNVYKVDDKSMLDFIRDKTAAPYFSNLVWFIGNHVVEIDQAIKKCSSNDEEQKKNNNCRLDDLVAEHLDHLHYVNDILLLGIEDLNHVLVDHLLNRLFLPVYLGGLEKDKNKYRNQEQQQDHLSVVLSLFLLSQVFMIVTHCNLLESLSDSLLQNNLLELIDCTENDYGTFYALTLVWAVFKKFYPLDKEIVDNEKVQLVFYNLDGGVNEELIRRIISNVVSNAVKFDSKVRLVTVSMATTLLLQILRSKKVQLPDRDLALLESHREENILSLQNYYKTEEMFLEIFEDEYLCGKDYSLENLLQDSGLLLPPVGSPLSFVAIDRRRPCGEGERCRRSMRVYFILRSLSLELRNETEKYLPLTNTQQCVGIEQNLDLTNSDLLSCIVICRVEGTKLRRFLVVDTFQLILVEPSHKRMGWGVVKFVGFLQDLEVLGDPNDSRCLHITVKSSPVSLMKKIKEAKSNNGGRNCAQNSMAISGPILAAKFMFDDHIRCMAARQRLVKGRLRARERKLSLIGRLLDQQQKPTSSSPPQRIRNYRPNSSRLPGVAVPSIQPNIGGGGLAAESNNRRRRSPKARSSSSQVIVSEIPLEERQPSGSGNAGLVSQEDEEEEAKVETSFVGTEAEEHVVNCNNRKKGEIMDV